MTLAIVESLLPLFDCVPFVRERTKIKVASVQTAWRNQIDQWLWWLAASINVSDFAIDFDFHPIHDWPPSTSCPTGFERREREP